MMCRLEKWAFVSASECSFSHLWQCIVTSILVLMAMWHSAMLLHQNHHCNCVLLWWHGGVLLDEMILWSGASIIPLFLLGYLSLSFLLLIQLLLLLLLLHFCYCCYHVTVTIFVTGSYSTHSSQNKAKKWNNHVTWIIPLNSLPSAIIIIGNNSNHSSHINNAPQPSSRQHSWRPCF